MERLTERDKMPGAQLPADIHDAVTIVEEFGFLLIFVIEVLQRVAEFVRVNPSSG